MVRMKQLVNLLHLQIQSTVSRISREQTARSVKNKYETMYPPALDDICNAVPQVYQSEQNSWSFYLMTVPRETYLIFPNSRSPCLSRM